MKEDKKAPICLSAFGTTVEKAQKSYSQIEHRIRASFPDREILWAFTSSRVRRQLQVDGKMAFSLDEAIRACKERGEERLAIQSLHVVPGQMDAAARETPSHGLSLAYGEPLLASNDDVRAVAAALEPTFRGDRMNVVVAHGNEKHPEYNRMNLALAEYIEAISEKLILWSVEGEPGRKCLNWVRERAQSLGGVHFIPLMMVSGDHILNDVLGQDEYSWARSIGAPEVSCAPSLALNDAIIDIYIAHLDSAIRHLEHSSCEGDVSTERGDGNG